MNRKLSPSKLSIRLGNINDYNGVMNINREVFQSFDYLPTMFHQLVQDKNHYMFIAEYDGKIVGYAARYFIQGDNHCVAISARTNPAYQKIGIGAELSIYADEYVRRLNSEFEKRYATMFTEKVEENIKTNKAVSRYFLYHMCPYAVSLDTVKENLGILEKMVDLTKAELFSLGDNALLQAITNDDSVRVMSKYNPYILIEGMLPYDITETTLKFMVARFHTYITRNTSKTSCQAISCMSIHRALDGKLKVDIHYTGLPVFDTWAAHVVQQIKHAIKIMPEKKWRCAIVIPETLDVKAVNNFLRPVFGDKLENDLFVTTRFVAAQKYPASVLAKL